MPIFVLVAKMARKLTILKIAGKKEQSKINIMFLFCIGFKRNKLNSIYFSTILNLFLTSFLNV
jgi:hypothetical protein